MLEKINPKTKLSIFKSPFGERFLEEDPLSGVVNLADLMLVFAVGLMLSIITYYSLPELLSQKQEITLIKNPGQVDMELIKKKGTKLEKYHLTSYQLKGEGERMGSVYKLKSGEMVYVPEDKFYEK